MLGLGSYHNGCNKSVKGFSLTHFALVKVLVHLAACVCAIQQEKPETPDEPEKEEKVETKEEKKEEKEQEDGGYKAFVH